MKRKITFAPGRRIGGVDAETIAGELTRIYQRDHRITASSVVAESQPEDAPLHPAFEWDDSEAAKQYRLSQARNIIKAPVVVIEGDAHHEPLFVHVSIASENEGEYHPVDVAVSRIDLYENTLAECRLRVKQANDSMNALIAAAERYGRRTTKTTARAQRHLASAHNLLEQVHA